MSFHLQKLYPMPFCQKKLVLSGKDNCNYPIMQEKSHYKPQIPVLIKKRTIFTRYQPPSKIAGMKNARQYEQRHNRIPLRRENPPYIHSQTAMKNYENIVFYLSKTVYLPIFEMKSPVGMVSL